MHQMPTQAVFLPAERGDAAVRGVLALLPVGVLRAANARHEQMLK